MRYRAKLVLCPKCGAEHVARWTGAQCRPCKLARDRARIRRYRERHPRYVARTRERLAQMDRSYQQTPEYRHRAKLLRTSREEAAATGVPLAVVRAQWGIQTRFATKNQRDRPEK